MRPRVFVASSSEELDVALAIQENLEEHLEVTVWPQDVFQPSKPPLDSLVAQLTQSDFGIFVFSPEDILIMREKKTSAVRDNVVFELGLLVGKLGRNRGFIVIPKSASRELHLPSDLVGVTPVKYDDQRKDLNLAAATGSACNKILRAIRRLADPSQAAATAEPGSILEAIRESEGVTSHHPVAVAIGLLPRDSSIRGPVESFLQSRGWEMPILEFNLPGITGEADLELLIKGLADLRRQINRSRHSEVHLFLAGPVQAATIIGAQYCNWIPVKLYQRSRTPSSNFYEYWLPLHKF